MAIFRGAGGAGDATTDSSSQALAAINAAAEAEVSATEAASSASAAATSATSAASSATAAASSASSSSSSATSASTSATNAASSASDAADSESNAAASATAAAASATTATTKASEAASSATAAASSASAAATSATNAASSATAAASSALAASTSETNAAASETAAATSETNAASSESAAATSATNAANSATAAATSATNASNSATAAATSATNAATSATNASNSATAAATSETNAANSASAASTSATNASNSATSAATSATNAATSYDNFDDRYLGNKSSAPSVDNDGDPLLTGALYFDTTSNSMKVYSGSAWLDAYASLSGALLATNNLSDLNDVPTARTNLGLGTAALVADDTLVHLAGTETITGAKTFSTNPTVSSGTANGVAYLNGSKVLTTGSALTFDGTNLGIGTSSPSDYYAGAAKLVVAGSSESGITIANTTSTSNGFLYFADGTTGTAEYAGYLQYSHTNDFLALGTAATERMRINSSGNVGIGTSSPTEKLTVAGNIKLGTSGTTWIYGPATTGRSVFSNSDNTTYIIANGSAYGGNNDSGLSFIAGSTNTMVFNSAGNLGLGVTPSASTAGTYKGLYVGHAMVKGAPSAATATFASNTDLASNYIYTGYASKYDQGAGEHYWYTAPSGTAGTAISFTQAMTLNASGNLGIGTSSPSSKLEVTDNIKINGANPALRFLNGDAAEMYIQCLQVANGGRALRIFDSAAGSERMRIDSSGNVGIGTSSPGYKLSVDSGSTDASALFNSTSANGSHIRLASSGTVKNYIGNAAGFITSGSADDLGLRAVGKISFATNGAAADMTLDSSGNLGLGVTPSSWGGSYKALQVGKSASLWSAPSADIGWFSVNTYFDGTNYKYVSADKASYYQQYQGAHVWSTAPTGTIGATASFTQAMTLDASGNLGIGTSSPATYGLTVQKNQSGVAGISLRNTNTGASVYSGIYFGGATAATDGFIGSLGDSATAYGGARSLVLGTNTATPVVVMTGGTEKMRIDSSGNLLFNSGYGSAATAYGCRAWVNFDGTGTVAIRASGNVSSITDNGTGDYTINFSTAIVDANYSSQLASSQNSAAQYAVTNMVSQSTTALRVQNSNLGAALVDNANMLISIFR